MSKYGVVNSPVIVAYDWGQVQHAYSLNEWNTVTMTRTAAGTSFYLNGALVMTGTAGAAPNAVFYLGNYGGTQQWYKGRINNCRFSNGVRSDAWIKAESLALKNELITQADL